VLTERLPDDHAWFRVADPGWADPLDPGYAAAAGGRWNPPGSFPVLYLNEDVVTARINLQVFLAGLPYGPEDLRDHAGPVLVEAALPRRQDVADVHSPGGVSAAGLPASYPRDASGVLIGHERCQPIGVTALEAGLRGVRCRSARAPYGAGRELAWFPASPRSRARTIAVQAFTAWFWA
jgi:hypothetical protein